MKRFETVALCSLLIVTSCTKRQEAASHSTGHGNTGPNPAAKEHQIQGSISTTDLAGTIRRSEELLKETNDELTRVTGQNQGNDIALRPALDKVIVETKNKWEREYAKLQGQTVQWRFTVREVKLYFEQVRVYLNESPGIGGGDGAGLYIQFGEGGGWDFLQVGKEIPSALAEKLRPGDPILVRGKASVKVDAKKIETYSILNKTVCVEVHLADITAERAN